MRRYEKSIYVYTKKRKNFGMQPLFQLVPPAMLDSICVDRKEQISYGLRNPVHRQVQATMPQSEHDADTKQLVTHEQGINHTEGGWPREVHLYNEDHLARHRRRVLHEDNYIHSVLNLTPKMEHYIDQNNAIDMYQTYFADMHPQASIEKYTVRIANAFHDPMNRPVSCIVWTNEKQSKLAVSYCHKKYPSDSTSSLTNDCYLWDILNNAAPINKLTPIEPCWQLASSPVDHEILVAGLENGTVSIFDIRQNSIPISSSTVYNSHKAPITGLLYTHTRTNTEFFTGSIDGQCLWWDMRDLSKPLDQLPMSVKISSNEEANLSNAESVSSLQFDNGLPTKFLCGTETGLVINVNRMGKSHSEKLSSFWKAHLGPVRTVQRSPCTLRMFLTCGDWSVRVWSEEVRSAPIIVTKPYRQQVHDVAWAPLRFSSYMVACADGIFYYWDFLRRYREPIATLQVSKNELTNLTPHADGELVAVGDHKGSLHLLQLSENMVIPGNHDKQLMMQTYERETRREHLLDIRLKEIHLKLRLEEETLKELAPEEENLEDEQEMAVEEEFFRIVNEEIRQFEGMSTSLDSFL